MDNTSRNIRQKECIQKWIKAGGKGTITASTGFGKSYLGLKLIKAIIKKKSNASIIIVVPTTVLKEQWYELIDNYGFSFNCTVLVVNSAIKDLFRCDLLVLDEYLSSLNPSNCWNILRAN